MIAKPGSLLYSASQKPLPARVAQGQETGLGRTGTMSVGRDELHRALKIGDWDRRILRRNFLIRPVIDTVASELFPVAHPVAAESAIAVINQQRPGTGNRRFRCVGRRISGCLLHDFNRDAANSRAVAFIMILSDELAATTILCRGNLDNETRPGSAPTTKSILAYFSSGR